MIRRAPGPFPLLTLAAIALAACGAAGGDAGPLAPAEPAPTTPSPGLPAADAGGGPVATPDSGPGGAPPDAAPDAAPPGPADLDAYLPAQMATLHLPGLAAAIVKGDQLVWSHGYGLAHVAKKVPVTTATLFHLASISKTVTATAVMQLVEGGLSLDGDASANVGFSVRNPKFPGSAIPLRMLLSHVSSITDSNTLFTLVTENAPSPITLEQFVTGYFVPGGAYYDAAQNFDPNAPGTTFNYSNAAMTLAGYHVQAIAKVPFDDYCKAHVFTPLGMTESSYRLASLDPEHIAMQYDSDGTTEIGNDDYPDFPDGELRTSVDQFARFLLMFMNGGTYAGAKVLEPATVTEMQRVQYPSISPDQGLAWYYDTRGTRRVLGHAGAVVGASTKMGFDPATHVGVILFSNGNATLAGQTTSDGFDAVFDHVLEVAESL